MCPLVSIVIPCYNASCYIFSCVQTLLSQSYYNWEAIFVDDGSVDDTLQKLKKVSYCDERLKVYTKSNEGAAKTREYGIRKTSGEYLIFLDVDDTFTGNALETLVNAFDNETDIVVSGFNIVKKGCVIKRKIMSQQKLDKIDYLKKVLCGKFGWELCAKMYRRKLFFGQINIPNKIRIGEDAAVFVQLACKASYIKILSEQIYNYIQYKQSASHIRSKKYAEETLQAGFFIEKELEKEYFYNNIKKEVDAMYLLFYSNSIRKGYLNHKHPLVRNIKDNHFSLQAFIQIPFYKTVYILFIYYFGRFFKFIL